MCFFAKASCSVVRQRYWQVTGLGPEQTEFLHGRFSWEKKTCNKCHHSEGRGMEGRVCESGSILPSQKERFSEGAEARNKYIRPRSHPQRIPHQNPQRLRQRSRKLLSIKSSSIRQLSLGEMVSAGIRCGSLEKGERERDGG